jgi:hypothetical protein
MPISHAPGFGAKIHISGGIGTDPSSRHNAEAHPVDPSRRIMYQNAARQLQERFDALELPGRNDIDVFIHTDPKTKRDYATLYVPSTRGLGDLLREKLAQAKNELAIKQEQVLAQSVSEEAVSTPESQFAKVATQHRAVEIQQRETLLELLEQNQDRVPEFKAFLEQPMKTVKQVQAPLIGQPTPQQKMEFFLKETEAFVNQENPIANFRKTLETMFAPKV